MNIEWRYRKLAFKEDERGLYLEELKEMRKLKDADFKTKFDTLVQNEAKLETMIDISEAKSLEWNGSRDVSLTMGGIGISMLISFVLANGDSLYSFHVLISGLLTGVFAFLAICSINRRDSYANLAIELKDRYKEKCLSDSKETLSERMVAFAAIKQATVEAEAKLEEVKEALNDANKKPNKSN